MWLILCQICIFLSRILFIYFWQLILRKGVLLEKNWAPIFKIFSNFYRNKLNPEEYSKVLDISENHLNPACIYLASIFIYLIIRVCDRQTIPSNLFSSTPVSTAGVCHRLSDKPLRLRNKTTAHLTYIYFPVFICVAQGKLGFQFIWCSNVFVVILRVNIW